MLFTKIRYRLVFNRTKRLNKNGRALVQIEATQHKRKKYFSTKIYLEADQWDYGRQQVINHDNATYLNAYLYELKLKVEQQELLFWKRGQDCTLDMLKQAVSGHDAITDNFLTFAHRAVDHSTRRPSTKQNMKSTIRILEKTHKTITFQDLTPTFITKLTRQLHQTMSAATAGKHLRHLRTLINAAIQQGYMPPSLYPFAAIRIKREKAKHRNLTDEEVTAMENLQLEGSSAQIRDAFLFSCYTGLRFSDFRAMRPENIHLIEGERWVSITSAKTGVKSSVPIESIFEGKAHEILERYGSVRTFADIGNNADVNKALGVITQRAGITKKVTFHVARHTCATMLIRRGVPITTIQRILGHTSVSTTQLYAETDERAILTHLRAANKK